MSYNIMNIIYKGVDIIFQPSVILISSMVIMFIGRYVFDKKYINCFDIIKNHILCFKNNNNKISVISMILYFGVPGMLAIALVKTKVIDDQAINIITIIVSILTSMFFTLLTLILDMKEKIKNNTTYNANEANISSRVLNETYYSIMFEILISVALLILCFVNLFASKFSAIESCIIYYLVFILLVNLFMILKRIFRVIENDLDK